MQSVAAVPASCEEFCGEQLHDLALCALSMRRCVQRIHRLDGIVMIPMFTMILKQFKILRAVVVAHTIDVMHDFIWFQQTAKCLLHHQPVFQYRVAFVSVRMIRCMHADITLIRALSAAFPRARKLAFLASGVTGPRTKSASKDGLTVDREGFLTDRADNNRGHKTLRESVDWRGPAVAETAAVSV